MKPLQQPASGGPQPIKNHEELSVAVGLIGEHAREIAQLEGEFNSQMERLRESIMGKAGLLEKAKLALEEAVTSYALAHHESPTGGFEGSILHLPTGEVQVAWKPPAYVFTESEEATLNALKRKGLERLIRVKEKVNKRFVAEENLSERELAYLKMERVVKQVVHIRPGQAPLGAA